MKPVENEEIQKLKAKLASGPEHAKKHERESSKKQEREA